MRDGTSGIEAAPDVVDLGVDPLYRMLRSEYPFDECPIAAEGLSLSCQEIRVVGTWAHQFFTYLELIEVQYGPDIRKQVQQVILYSLNQYGEAGNQLDSFLKLTQEAIESYSNDLTGGRGDVGVTLETYLAIALLIKIPDSPYFVGGSREAPDIPHETINMLSRCLERGANRVKKYYQRGDHPGASRRVSLSRLSREGGKTQLAEWLINRRSRKRGVAEPG